MIKEIDKKIIDFDGENPIHQLVIYDILFGKGLPLLNEALKEDNGKNYFLLYNIVKIIGLVNRFTFPCNQGKLSLYKTNFLSNELLKHR